MANSLNGWISVAAVVFGIGLNSLATASGQTVPTDAHAHQSQFPIPAAIRAEHAEIHEKLVAATKAHGQVGEAARKLVAILEPHFQREEQIALPPLALLEPLSREKFHPRMRDVLVMTDALRRELPQMLQEHKAIHAATARMGAAAKAEGNAAVQRLAETLELHAASEEQVFYPAAILVGDLVRGHSASSPAQP